MKFKSIVIDPSGEVRPRLFTLVAGLAGFCAYFSMYAFRKPFAAAHYTHEAGWHFAVDYKTALLIAQVLGYTLSKFIGIKVIAEIGRTGRAWITIGLIGLSWVALILFALVPAPWNVACLFLNGLALGMIWGLIFSYMEGRRVSDMLGAILCASFIVSSGVVKSVAVWLMNQGVTEYWMPATTGVLFFPLLFASMWVLEQLPPPDAADEMARTARVPMSGADRSAFLRDHGMGLVLLVLSYVFFTAMRDFRDNFAAEIWAGLGYAKDPGVFSQSELPIGVVVLGVLGALVVIRNNRTALLAMHGVIVFGAVLLAAGTLAFQMHLLSPLTWMIVTGAGLYFGYTPFNAMLFDRMIAALGRAGNAGFLIYIADSSGYAGSVALQLYRSLAAPKMAWISFFMTACYVTAAVVTALTLLSAFFFARESKR